MQTVRPLFVSTYPPEATYGLSRPTIVCDRPTFFDDMLRSSTKSPVWATFFVPVLGTLSSKLLGRKPKSCLRLFSKRR